MRSTDRFALEDVRCHVGEASLPVTNLSVGGFYVACEPPLPLGQSIAFELVFSDGWRLAAVGRVAWVNSPEAGSTPGLPTGCGITITKIAFPDKLAIVDRLRRAAVVVDPRR
jgi:Tfp pilus assembly protein PilZ